MIIIRRVVRSRSNAYFSLESLDDRYRNLLSKISEIEDTYKEWDTPKNAGRGYQWELSDDAARIEAKLNRKSPLPINTQSVKNPSSKGLLNGNALAVALLAGTAIGAGAYFIRRRRSKNGKVVVERVRRKTSTSKRNFEQKSNLLLFNNPLSMPKFTFSESVPAGSIGLDTVNKVALLVGAVGAGTYFIRRRRSKNGKQIIERVRRK